MEVLKKYFLRKINNEIFISTIEWPWLTNAIKLDHKE